MTGREALGQVMPRDLQGILDQATPGPWTVERNDANPGLWNVYAENKAYGASGLIAPVLTPPDARLIALAPDLARWAPQAHDAVLAWDATLSSFCDGPERDAVRAALVTFDRLTGAKP
jgi:hypothetical protein